MKRIQCLLVFAVTILLSYQAQAQNFGGTNLGFRGMAGYLGFGVAEFTVLTPSANFRMDDGTMVYLAGEKELGQSGLFITISINYMDTEGQSFYEYSTLGGTNYSTPANTEVNFSSEHLQLGLGLKFKLFPTTFFRPYGEGGGLFGYHTIEYNPRAGDITNADGGEKLKDGLTGFGWYMEAGVEIDFSEVWGIRTGVRYQLTETREF
ncbi:MAG: outer membrane beta-barrel protein, partial [Bdellovibrionales bacterium]|nr:porin family protein [Bdellovibrionales bacterium]NQZ20406.1 outer membrane beta-barrel protein [Bdellovibrionales bacterium]